MDNFIIKNDFEALIQEVNLDEVIADTSIAINSAIEEAAGFIRHRYDEAKTFAIVNTYLKTKAYVVDDRIYWEETDWLDTEIYNAGDLVAFNTTPGQVDKDAIYLALDTTVAGESPTTTPAKWQIEALNKTYYTVSTGTTIGDLPSDDTKFSLGDSRNQKLKDVVIDIVLYNIHSRITPRSVPEVRLVRYDGNDPKQQGGAIGWLKMVQKGTITPLLPVTVDGDGVAPQSGERLSYGKSSSSPYSY